MSHFISYSRKDDEAFVKRLVKDLAAAGVSVWWDRQAMESRGRTFLQELRDAVTAADRVVLVVGPAVPASDYVKAEWQLAEDRCVPIVPVLRRGDYDLIPKSLASLHCIDMRPSRAYARALAELLRILKTPVPTPAPLIGVDALPAHFVPRAEELQRLGELLLADVRRPTVIRSSQQTASLEGMAGIGKSVLAAAFARACDTRRAFADGVVWLRVGPGADTLSLVRRLGRLVGDIALEQAPSLTAAPAAVGAALRDKSLLLVLDDIWDVAGVEMFANGLGTRCRLLLTTRDGSLARALGAGELSLDSLEPAQALLLLAQWADQPADALPAEATDVVAECGYLPLAIALIGAMVRGRPDRWAHALRRLKAADLEKIQQRFPNYPYPSLFRAIDVSFQALEPGDRAAYLDLAVFKEATPIPLAAVKLLWQRRHGIDEADAIDLADRLANRSMLRQIADGHVLLHALQGDFVRQRAGDLTRLHRELIAAYHDVSGGRWANGPDDGYFFQMLPHHLASVGDGQAVVSLLIDYEWLEAKLRVTGMQALLADFVAARRQDLESADAIGAIHRALERSSHVIVRDPTQFPAQLIGRLADSRLPEISRLLAQAAAAPQSEWLRPAGRCLGLGTEALVAALTGHTDRINAVALTPDGRYAVSGSADQTVRLWDIEQLQLLHTFTGHTDSVTTVAVTRDGRLAASGAGWPRPFKVEIQIDEFLKRVDLRPSRDTSVRLWDLSARRGVRTLAGHDAAVRCVMFGSDDAALLSGGDDKSVHLWALASTDEGVEIDKLMHRVVLLAERTSAALVFAFSESGFRMFDLRKGRAVDGTLDVWTNPLAMEGETLKVLLQYTSPNGELFGLDLWDLAHDDPNVEKLDRLRTYTTYIRSACFVGESLIAAGLSDGRIDVMDRSAGTSRTLLGHSDEVSSLASSTDGRTLVSGSHDGKLLVWSVPAAFSGDASDTSAETEPDWTACVDISPDATIAARASAAPALEVWDVVGRRRIGTHPIPDHAWDLKLMPDGATAMLGGAGGWVGFVNTRTGAIEYQERAHADTVVMVALDSTGAFAATVGRDKVIRIWDLATRRVVKVLRGRDSSLAGVTLLPGARLAISRNTSGRCLVWDVSRARVEGELIGARVGPATAETYELTGPEARVVRRASGAIAALGDDRHVVVGGPSGSIVVWDAIDRRQLHVLHDPRCGIVQTLSASRDGRLLLTTDERQSCGVWDLIARRALSFVTFDASELACALAANPPVVAARLAGFSDDLHFLQVAPGATIRQRRLSRRSPRSGRSRTSPR